MVAEQRTPTTAPPVLIYLPSLADSGKVDAGKADAVKNSGPRIAEMVAVHLTAGEGSFAATVLPSDDKQSELTDGRRIVQIGGEPVLDILTYDYRPRLELKASTENAGLIGKLRQLVSDLQFIIRAGLLWWGAGKHAKSFRAKLQVLYGAAVLFGMLVAFGLAVLAVLNAVGLGWELPAAPESFEVAVAIGLTAVVTWMLAKAKPIANRATKFAAEILEYAEDERRAESVCKGLTPMLDCILEKTPDREIHILGYSFGAVVAVDYLFPRSSMWPSKDPHTHARARMVRTLSTVGCPLDFIRLYKPDYLAHREPHVRGIPWLNIFIAADVLGSNFHDGDDFKGESPNGTKEPPNGTENPPNGTEKNPPNGTKEPPNGTKKPPNGITIDGEERTSLRYTNDRLTLKGIFLRRGFISHAGYWGDRADEANCLHLVLHHIQAGAE